jgi:hypothetical protein
MLSQCGFLGLEMAHRLSIAALAEHGVRRVACSLRED